MELVVQSGPDSGKIYQIRGSQMVAGRQAGTEIMLNDLQISRRHAAFELINGLLVVNDLGSANGTRLNGQPLPPNQPRTLNPGDQIQLGDTILVVRASTALNHNQPSFQPAPPAQPVPAPYQVQPAYPSQPAPYPPGQQPAPAPYYGYPPPSVTRRKNNLALIGGLLAILAVAILAIIAILVLGNRTDPNPNQTLFNPPSVPASSTTPTRGPAPTQPAGPSGSNPPPPSPPARGPGGSLAFTAGNSLSFIIRAGPL